jgi:hypothetical protein
MKFGEMRKVDSEPQVLSSSALKHPGTVLQEHSYLQSLAWRFCLCLVMWAMFASLTRIARFLQAHTRSFLPGMRLIHNQSFSASQRRIRVQRWHLVPKRYFTKNNAVFLIWTVIAMEFRASSSGATELQTATFISITYLPVSQLWGDIFTSRQSVTFQSGKLPG